MPPSRNQTTITPLGNYGTKIGESPPALVPTSGKSGVLYLGSEGNYGYPNFPPNSDIGGLFRVDSDDWYSNIVDIGTIDRLNMYHGEAYTGAMVAMKPTLSATWVDSQPNDVVGDEGVRAYNRMKPTQPSFNALNSIYELKDVPGMLRQRLHQSGLKNIGNYSLALQFGWKPLLRDIRDFVLTQMSAQQRLQQLLRDNGRPVRRRIVIGETETSTYSTGSSYGAFAPGLITQYYRKIPTYSLTTTNRSRSWASARFRYWLPPGPRDITWTRKMKAAIFGIKPTPSVVWNALPWSWLVDWFAPIGPMLENMEAGVADRCAADYCYIMKEYTTSASIEANGYFYKRNAPFDITGNSYRVKSKKIRLAGDPFGWNTPETNLSGMQLGILGALGLSRLP